MDIRQFDETKDMLERRDVTQHTRRPVSTGAESHLFVPYSVLDHGYVSLIDYMGNDCSIENAARRSYRKGTRSSSDTAVLLNYLMRNAHTTPFEQVNVAFLMKLPIFVARQLIRHRTASVNEESARYSVLSNEFYVPELEQIKPQSSSNKQGRAGELTEEQAAEVQRMLIETSLKSYKDYELLLGSHATDSEFAELQADEFNGIARELARMRLTLNFYTSWVWEIDMKNLLGFLRLRDHGHAQWEIQQYAKTMARIVEDGWPITYTAYNNCVKHSATLTAAQLSVLSRITRPDVRHDDVADLIGGREFSELKALL